MVANRKYTSRDKASTMVVMKGLAITAGSSFRIFATMGSTAPTVFASSTVTNIARHTTATRYAKHYAPGIKNLLAVLQPAGRYLINTN